MVASRTRAVPIGSNRQGPKWFKTTLVVCPLSAAPPTTKKSPGKRLSALGYAAEHCGVVVAQPYRIPAVLPRGFQPL
jgi:hypothetical protein